MSQTLFGNSNLSLFRPTTLSLPLSPGPSAYLKTTYLSNIITYVTLNRRLALRVSDLETTMTTTKETIEKFISSVFEERRITISDRFLSLSSVLEESEKRREREREPWNPVFFLEQALFFRQASSRKNLPEPLEKYLCACKLLKPEL